MSCKHCAGEREFECHLKWTGPADKKPKPNELYRDPAVVILMIHESICTSCGRPREHTSPNVYFDMVRRFGEGDAELLR